MILVFKHFQNFILHPSFLWHFCLNWHRWIWQRSAWFSTEQKHWIIVIIGILLPKLFWPTVKKKCSSDWEKTFEIQGWRLRICKNFEITWTIYLNSGRSEQYLLTECFLTYSWRFLMYENRNMQEKLENSNTSDSFLDLSTIYSLLYYMNQCFSLVVEYLGSI